MTIEMLSYKAKSVLTSSPTKV